MFIIDRFEGDYAVVEKDIGDFLNIKRSELPSNAKEGDCLLVEQGVYKIDEKETKRLREEILNLQNKLWK